MKKKKDMYTPVIILLITIMSMIICGAGFVNLCKASLTLYNVVGCIFFAIMIFGAIFIILTWKNRYIIILNEEEFEFRSTMGKKMIIHFSEVEKVCITEKGKYIKLNNGKEIGIYFATTEKFNNAFYCEKYLDIEDIEGIL